MPPADSKLAKKIADVMAEVGTVAKKGHNEHFNYDFVQEEDVSEAIRPALAKRHIAFLPDVQSHERIGTLTVLMVKCRFIDGETGEELAFNVVGYGGDTQDKGANKALTAAVKYALIKVFLISSGEDPDRGGPAAPAPAARAAAAPKPAAPAAQPKPAVPTQPAGPTQAAALEAMIQVGKVASRVVGKDKKQTKYTITSVDGTKYETFSKSYADLAFSAIEGGDVVTIRYTVSQWGNDIERENGVIVAEVPGGEVPYTP